jgi:hypothetical protein
MENEIGKIRGIVDVANVDEGRKKLGFDTVEERRNFLQEKYAYRI